MSLYGQYAVLTEQDEVEKTKEEQDLVVMSQSMREHVKGSQIHKMATRGRMI